MIRVAFMITDWVYNSESGVWGEPIILLALVMLEIFVLCLVVRALYQGEMLKASIDSISVL